MIKNNLPFIRPEQSEEFTFYMIPKQLLKDERFEGISTDALLLYSALLDRTSLSIKNHWWDEEEHVYIIYSREAVTEEFKWKRDKVTKLFKQLREFGLIIEKIQGLNRPNLIYVKSHRKEKIKLPPLTIIEKNTDITQNNINIEKNASRTTEKPSSGINLRISEKSLSRLRKNRCPNYGKTVANDTNKNDTNRNDTNLSIYQKETTKINSIDMIDINTNIKKRKDYEQIIKQNIKYDLLLKTYNQSFLDGIVSLIIDTLCCPNERIRISKYDQPIEIVKNQFLQLTNEHIKYLCNSLQTNETNIKNIKNYILTSLYNSVNTKESYEKMIMNGKSSIAYKFNQKPSYDIEEYEKHSIFD